MTKRYDKNGIKLFQGDCFEVIKKIKTKSIDMIFADPPYFLSNNGITCVNGKMVSVNKGDWDKGGNEYKDKYEFNKKWIKLCKRVLKDDGTMWISGTYHNIYVIGAILQKFGFKIINNITWRKTNPPPNLSCRAFTHSTETILWAKKDLKNSKHLFNYSIMKEMNNNKQMKDVWETSTTKKSEKKYGKHPTQKPLEIMRKIILSSTNEDDLILDPFNGSGTTGVICQELNRKYFGIELEQDYIELSIKRFEHIQ